MVIEIIEATYMKDYLITLKFSDGKIKTIDFAPFLEQSRNPMTRKYLDKNEFKKFCIEYGDLQWNDYELCFPVIDLYEGNLVAHLPHAA